MNVRSMFLGFAAAFGTAAGTAAAGEPLAPPRDGAAIPQYLPATEPAVPTYPGPDGSECGVPSCYDCLCSPPGRVWASGEWLYWAAAGQPLPALVTTSPPGTLRATAGTLGTPGTAVLFGDNRANDDFRNGFRGRVGVWLDDCQTVGLEGTFFFLGRSRDAAGFGSDGSQILTRPFVNPLTGLQDSELVSFPNVLAGTVTADATSDVIGGGFNYLRNVCCDPCGRFDLTTGFQYLNLRDRVAVVENLTSLPGSGITPGTNIVVRDRLGTDNDFYGWSVGGNYERRLGMIFVGVRGSVALGVSHQEITINGSTTFTPPGGPAAAFPGGLLAQRSNIGSFSNDEFAVMPQVGVRAGVQVARRARVFVGYDWLYWSTVARAGDQIDPTVNTNQLPPVVGPFSGPAVPSNRINVTDYWLQGVSIGAEVRF